MNIELKVMRKAYKLDDDIRRSLTTAPEDRISFNRTLNGDFTLQYCGYCNGLLLGHRRNFTIAGEDILKKLLKCFKR